MGEPMPGGTDPQRLGLLASALAGRPVTVTAGPPGAPAVTDGRSIRVDPAADPAERLRSVVVQAALLAAGSLDVAVVRRLRHRTRLARRYLAVEGARALAGQAALLPPAARDLLEVAPVRSASPAESLAVARGATPVADPPPCFGAIDPARLLATAARDRSEAAARHAPRRAAPGRLERIPEPDAAPDADDIADPFTSPVGGGGALGKLFRRMMTQVRRLDGGGPPGADAPTHRTADGVRGAHAVLSTAAVPADGDPLAGPGSGRRYPEWDHRQRRYLPDWCTVYEADAPDGDGAGLPWPDVHPLRRPLTRLGTGLQRRRRQVQGDDIDLDAAVAARVELLAGSAPDEAVYTDSLRRRRDLAVLVLLDVSGSSAEAGTAGATVHDQQRAAAAALTVALNELGDRVALYAFHSQGRGAVHLLAVKRFDERLGVTTMRRLAALRPGGYSRLGAAIRHGTALIGAQAGTGRRLLVVCSDGLAYDHGYERTHGAADVRRALLEARRAGIGCLCLTVGAATDSGALRAVFGSAAHATIPLPTRLGEHVGVLFRSALHTADLRRRVA